MAVAVRLLHVADSDRGHRLDLRCRTICLVNADRQDLHLGRHLHSVTVRMMSTSQTTLMMVSIQLIGDFHVICKLAASVGQKM